MGRLHLKNIVLPAVLASCTIFSALTLPAVLFEDNPIVTELSSLFAGDLQPILKSENKGASIRYIGSAIVASVATGLLTVEVLRRSTKANGEESDSQPLVSTRDERPQPDQDEIEQILLSEMSRLTEWTNTSVTPQLSRAVAGNLPMVTTATLPEADTMIPRGAESRSEIAVTTQNGQCCQIKMHDTNHAPFALDCGGEYYRFFRSRDSQEKAMAIAQKLTHKGKQVVLTPLQEGYAVWIREPAVTVKTI